MKPSILVSACLLGVACRYDGKDNAINNIQQLQDKYHLVPICPEVAGGLPTPRVPAERLGSRVINKVGQDVTSYFQKGAEQALQLAQEHQCICALLKARSPSCGVGSIYDGTFTKQLVAGHGVTADLLQQHNILLYTEEDIHDL